MGRIGLMGWGLVPVRIWLMGNCRDAVVISGRGATILGCICGRMVI